LAAAQYFTLETNFTSSLSPPAEYVGMFGAFAKGSGKESLKPLQLIWKIYLAENQLAWRTIFNKYMLLPIKFTKGLQAKCFADLSFLAMLSPPLT
jgi:hypothetical protein